MYLHLNTILNTVVSLQKLLAHFLLIGKTEENIGIKHFLIYLNEVIFDIFDQIKVVNRTLQSLQGELL